MIRVPSLELPTAAAAQLGVWQREIDDVADYAERVLTADRRFKARNDARNEVFREVRRHLGALCYGEQRCTYCETSIADQVEHIRPRSQFPEHVFVWRNYIHACRPCDVLKGNNYPRRVGDVVRNVARPPRAPIEPPPPGEDMLIDPRTEDPSEFMTLDLDTAVVVPRPGLDAHARERADQTIATLHLNRSPLVRARREQRVSYVARLRNYIHLRDDDEAADAGAYAEAIRGMGHPLVWNEMRRQHARHPALHRLFVAAPEALAWEPRAQGLGHAGA